MNQRKAKIDYLKAIQAGKPITPLIPVSVIITKGHQGFTDGIGLFDLCNIDKVVKHSATVFILPDNGRNEKLFK